MVSTNWRGYRVAAWVGQFLLAIAVVVALARGNWKNGLELAGFLVASLVFVALDQRLPTLFDLLFVVAALLNAGGWVWGLFYLPGPYDEITHAFTIFSVTLALSFLVYGSLLTSFHHHRMLFVLVIASFGIAIGAIWEIIEWVTGSINSLNDTIMDLVMDTTGSTVTALVSLWALQERTRRESTPEA